MTTTNTRVLNLAEEMENSDGLGLSVTIERRMVVTMATGKTHMAWAARVDRGRLSKSGRPAKSVNILNLIGDDDDTPVSMLCKVADLYEHGNVEVYR